MMSSAAKSRRLETWLAYFTLGILVIYVPVETWVSIPGGLLHPMYLVDVVGMLLLSVGAIYSLRSRPDPAVGLLAAGWAWCAANGWRATSWRYLEIRQGGTLELGQAELVGTFVGTLIALACMAWALFLSTRPLTQSTHGEEP